MYRRRRLPAGRAAILQIEDAVPGIATDDMNRIFGPFFRGQSPRGEGTRFGLSIVKRIVDSLKGSNSPGECRPCHPSGTARQCPTAISTESSRKSEKRIERWSAFRTATASVRAPRANETWRCRPRRETPLSRLDAWDGTMDMTYVAGDAIKLDIGHHNARGASQ
jgi:hypothetical protein